MPATSIPETIVRDRPLPVTGKVARRLDHRSVFLLVLGASVCMLLLNVIWRETYEGDEGFYGVTAQNMLQSPAYLLRPSSFPGGDFAAGKDAFAHPPYNSYLYALALWLGEG